MVEYHLSVPHTVPCWEEHVPLWDHALSTTHHSVMPQLSAVALFFFTEGDTKDVDMGTGMGIVVMGDMAIAMVDMGTEIMAMGMVDMGMEVTVMAMVAMVDTGMEVMAMVMEMAMDTILVTG